ncbi:MAG: hypothetical protein PVJ42_05445 [bacterium]|jgi:hypothetical protein
MKRALRRMKKMPVPVLLAALLVACAAATCAGGLEPGSSEAFDAYLRTTLRQVDVPVEDDASIRHTREEAARPKSTLRAMLLSALMPGLGEMYVGGTRGYITGGVLVGIDAMSIYKYFDLNGQGDDLRDAYREYADRHYSKEKFGNYIYYEIAQYNTEFAFCEEGGDFEDPDKCDSVLNYYFPLADDDDFYEQIDIVDRFVFGWDDWEHAGIIYTNAWNAWDPNSEIPEVIETETARRLTYKSMRDEANDAYSSADKYAWIMLIGRVVSVVDALILTRIHNSQIASLGSRMNLSFQVKSITDPAFKVGVKMRF